MLCADGKVIVTVDEPLVVVKAEVNVVDVGIVVTWNLLSLKWEATKLEFVIDEKLSSNIIAPLFILCAYEKVMVTIADPLVVLNALVKVVVALIGCMS